MDKVEKIASIVLPNQLFEKSPVFSNRLHDLSCRGIFIF